MEIYSSLSLFNAWLRRLDERHLGPNKQHFALYNVLWERAMASNLISGYG